jgi:hypothetical protein
MGLIDWDEGQEEVTLTKDELWGQRFMWFGLGVFLMHRVYQWWVF